MAKSLDVGRSWRTYAKHELMNSTMGQEVGVTGELRDAHRLVWIDLTAGDAALVDGSAWHDGCSPGILARHAVKSSKPVFITLHEIQAATFDRLLANLALHLPSLGYERTREDTWRIKSTVLLRACNVSGQQASVQHVQQNDAVFVLNDPNAITEWAMRDTFAREISDRTWLFRSLSTMGCNPAGLKRMKADERISWFDLVEAQQAALPTHRDLLLAAIERDEAQWAYLLGTASLWRAKTEALVRTAFKRCGRTAAMAWFRKSAPEFQDAKLQLFLTRNELRRIRGQESQWLAAARDARLDMIRAPECQDEPDTDLALFTIDDYLKGAA